MDTELPLPILSPLARVALYLNGHKKFLCLRQGTKNAFGNFCWRGVAYQNSSRGFMSQG